MRLEGLKWYDHPFLFTSFKIADKKQVATLKQLGIRDVVCVPEKCDVLPLEEDPVSDNGGAPKDAGAEETDLLWEVKRERAERLRKKKECIEACRRQYLTSQKRVGELMNGITSGNSQSVEQAVEFADTLAELFLPDAETSLVLVSLASKDESVYYHAVNVAVLSMLLAQKIGLSQEELRTLGLGALFHDIGKCRVDKKILVKEGPLSKPEEDFLRLHPQYGVELLRENQDAFPESVLDIVFRHHERSDGSGYPTGLAAAAIDRPSRIVAICDMYDNYCNRRDPADSLTPFEALSTMFSTQKSSLDGAFLSLFIHCLGIYPPGTIVQLNNGATGMVVSVNPKDQLHPSIVIYDPEIPPKEALIIDMTEQPDLKIVKSIRPATLTPEVFEYLSPRTRINYFVDAPDPAAPGPA